jgi:hypothetical protein
VADNFLNVNNENYFVVICFFKIATTIIFQEKLVRMGWKSCLFVYYEQLNGTELWMVKEGVTLNGGLESRTVEGMSPKNKDNAFYNVHIPIVGHTWTKVCL